MLIVVFTGGGGGGIGSGSNRDSGKDLKFYGMMIKSTVEETNQINWPYLVNFQSQYCPR